MQKAAKRRKAAGTLIRKKRDGELLQIDEGVAPILLNIGMHCLGCPSSQMETIEQAAMVHGIDSEMLVDEINSFLESRG